MSGFLSLLSRSGCSLETLTMDCSEDSMNERDIVKRLQYLPLISELNFEGVCIQDIEQAISNRLAVDRTLVPDLERIGVHFGDTSQICAVVPPIVSMARSRENRIAEGSCMKSLTVSFTLDQLRGYLRSRSLAGIKALMQSSPLGWIFNSKKTDGRFHLALGSIFLACD